MVAVNYKVGIAGKSKGKIEQTLGLHDQRLKQNISNGR
jgi:hypothetical protein